MAEIREWLRALPEPDRAAEERIWRRLRDSRRPRPLRWTVPVLVGAGAVAAIAWFALRDPPRTVELRTAAVDWSGDVHLDVDGHGVATGTRRDVAVAWESGTVRVEVEAHAGNRVAVETEEARIEVTGTVFSVRRDALGVTTTVERGSVAVRCADGWAGALRPEDGPRTCWPVRPAALLGRADALLAAGAPPDEVLATVDRGLAVAEAGSAAEGELLARRVRAGTEANRVGDVLADADRYLASADRGRRVEVLRAASRLAYRERGCAAALPYLAPLEAEGSAEDRVVLAACLPARQDALLRAALASGEPIEPGWRAWAASQLAGGE